ncbi:MAG TPA: tetratricopeptide repeat protein [Planctomycetes bacterium]|nr:tetratricopeptide repeat protein [Planctomycetota bacterium]
MTNQRAPNKPEAMIHLAGARAEMGQIGKARAMLLRALRLAPNDPMALALKARLGIK